MEAGNGGSYPGVYNAIMDAIGERAKTELGIPATPARIWETIHSG